MLDEERRPPWTLDQIRALRLQRKMDRDSGKRDQSIASVRLRCEKSLSEFVREAWHILEPRTPYVHGWVIDAICEHLEAVTAGQINRLLINVPPGFAKSLIVSVFWPSWEWGAKHLTSYRYISTTFAESHAKRDCRRMRMLIVSDWYQRHWPHVQLIRAGETSFENDLTGWREGAAFTSLTGKRGNRLVIDDPHSVDKAESQTEREKAVRRFREGAVNRLNDQQKDAIVIIMQRLHESDISGEILNNEMGYTALVLPMEYEKSRHCETEIGFTDPRTRDGELLFPQRFPQNVVDALKRDMQIYSWAGQYQQRPAPRGGGIFPYNGWEYWHRQVAIKYGRNEGQFPEFSFILGSVDTAFTNKEENDFSAMVVFGVWLDLYGVNQVMLMHFWRKRLRFHDAVEEIVRSSRKMKCDRVLIENKSSGLPIFEEISRLTRDEEFAVQLSNPGADDKAARANTVSHLFREEREDGSIRDGFVWAPAITQDNGQLWPRAWAEDLMQEAASFPKGRHDDGVDAMVQGLIWLRKRGLVRRTSETASELYREIMNPLARPSSPAPLYPV